MEGITLQGGAPWWLGQRPPGHRSWKCKSLDESGISFVILSVNSDEVWRSWSDRILDRGECFRRRPDIAGRNDGIGKKVAGSLRKAV